MSHYHRAYLSGGTYFFTLVTYDRKPFLCTEKALKRLHAAFSYAIKKHRFLVMGLVVLPDHLHCIWRLPRNDADFSIRWNMIKRYFSIGMESESNHRREKQIWQRRFWEHLIRDEKDLEQHMNYIYYNPVKHGYVEKPWDWPHSTFKRAVAKNIYDADWGNTPPLNIEKMNVE